MLLSRKRETIYTRSIHGLSLRRSKVLSVSGSSLKWSKSLEQRSKKAAEVRPAAPRFIWGCKICKWMCKTFCKVKAFSQEAALAVAAVDKRKRGQDDSNAGSMNGNNVSRKFYSVKLLPGRPVLYPGVAYSFSFKFLEILYKVIGRLCISYALLIFTKKSYVLFMYLFRMLYSFLIEHYDGLLTFYRRKDIPYWLRAV